MTKGRKGQQDTRDREEFPDKKSQNRLKPFVLGEKKTEGI